jgi:dienelactone hydrolase
MTGLAPFMFAAGLLALLALPDRPAETDPLADALAQPLLPPETAQEELRAFVNRRVPPLKLPVGAAEWREASERLRKRLLEEVVYRGVPRPWQSEKLRVEWGDTLAPGGGYRIRKLRYEAVPGLWIPALLYEPESLAGRVPAVLNVNGHVGAPGKAIEYEQVRCINLAKRGMLALHPEWLNCGELAHAEFTHNRLAYLDLCGCSGLAVFYLAMRRGLDLLAAQPHADPERLAMTGLSGGGWQTIWLSALDPRVAACAPNAGYIGMPERLHHRGDIGDLEQNPAELLRLADYPHLTALLAPRPALLIFNEQDDCCFQTARALPSVFEPVVPFYRLSGHAARFRCHNNTDPGTHNYERDNREQFYRFLNDVFPGRRRQDEEIPCAGEILSFDALRVGVPPPLPPGAGADPAARGNRGFGALAESLLPSLPKSPWPETGGRPAAERWQIRSRRRLADLLHFHPLPPAVEATTPSPSNAQERRHPLRGSPSDASIVPHLLRVGNDWTLPAVEVRPPPAGAGTRPAGTAILASEGGRGATARAVRMLLERGLRVVTVDLALCGECDPPGVPRAQHAMMIGAAGERLLGLQAGQLLAVAEWASAHFHPEKMTLAGAGRVGSVIAAVAAALGSRRVDELIALDLPASLKLLIEERREYDACPELFAFGLLEQFDVREILGMTAARRILLVQPSGGAARVQQELGPVVEFSRRLAVEVKGLG